jgi:uncharacterized protein YdaU (DUF1376 family)
MSTTDTGDVSLFSSVHLGDRLRETVGWSALQFGVHVRLCDASWVAGGYLDDDDPEYLCRVAGAELSTWESIWKKIGKVWVKSDDGKLFHPATLAAIERARASRASLSERGRKGREAQLAEPKPGQAEPGNGPATAQPDAGHPNSDLRPPESEHRESNIEHPTERPAAEPAGPLAVLKLVDNPEAAKAQPGHAPARKRSRPDAGSQEFDRVWQQYPRHEKRARAVTGWAKQAQSHDGGEHGLADVILGALGWQVPLWRAEDTEFPVHVPHFSSYLADGRWTDEKRAPKPVTRRADGRQGEQPASWPCYHCGVSPCQCITDRTPGGTPIMD